MTEQVQEAMDYIKRKHEVGHLTQAKLMVHLIKLQECSDIVTELASVKLKKPKANKQ